MQKNDLFYNVFNNNKLNWIAHYFIGYIMETNIIILYNKYVTQTKKLVRIN